MRLVVDQSRRYHPLYQWLAEQIAAGKWGQPRSMYVQCPGAGLGCLGVHFFDLMRLLMGKNVTAVSAWLDPVLKPNPRGAQFTDPGGLVVLQMTDGVRAVHAQIEDAAGPVSIEINLTGARIRLDEKQGTIEIIERDLSVKPGPGVPARYAQVSPPEGLSAQPQLTPMVEGLFDNLLSDGPLVCDGAQGEASIRVLVAAHVSSGRGHVPVSPEDLTPEEIRLELPVT